MRADLHTHTNFSPDGRMAPETLVERAVSSKLTHVAVTDHHTAAGSMAAREYAERSHPELLVIIAEEVATREGEIIGLYLRETVPSGMSAMDTITAIREQGAVAIAAHPFDRLRSNLGGEALAKLATRLDPIEGYNGRTLWRPFDTAARRFASEHDLPMSLGSDAHALRELGRSWLELPAFEGPRELIAAMRYAQPHLVSPAPWLLPSSGLVWSGWWLRRARLARGDAA